MLSHLFSLLQDLPDPPPCQPLLTAPDCLSPKPLAGDTFLTQQSLTWNCMWLTHRACLQHIYIQEPVKTMYKPVSSPGTLWELYRQMPVGSRAAPGTEHHERLWKRGRKHVSQLCRKQQGGGKDILAIKSSLRKGMEVGIA